MTDTDNDAGKEDEERLAKLDADIEQARQHVKQQTHEDQETFIQEGDESQGQTDDTIAPPG
jgi:hypothetical protein